MGKDKDLISVIIPCYNASNYIDRCINSVRSQSYVNIEIICVNNNSTDDTYEKLLEHSKVDNRIKLYNSTTQGASATRNEGLRHISGEYVVFVDSDDYVGCDYVLNLYNAIITHNVHMACSGILRENNKGYRKKDFWMSLDNFNKHNEKFNLDYLLAHMDSFYYSTYGKIYKSSILLNKGVCFDNNLIIGEDILFNFNYMLQCENFHGYVISKCDYIYFHNTGSIIKSGLYNKSVFDQHKALKDLLIKHNVFEMGKYAYVKQVIAELRLFLKTSSLSFYKKLKDAMDDINIDLIQNDNEKDYKFLQKVAKKPITYFILNNLFFKYKYFQYFELLAYIILSPIQMLKYSIYGFFFIVKNINK